MWRRKADTPRTASGAQSPRGFALPPARARPRRSTCRVRGARMTADRFIALVPVVALLGALPVPSGWAAEAGQTTEPSNRFLTWAPTPPMGWNSWDCYGAAVNEAQTRANARTMAEKLKRYGWQYVVV